MVDLRKRNSHLSIENQQFHATEGEENDDDDEILKASRPLLSNYHRIRKDDEILLEYPNLWVESETDQVEKGEFLFPVVVRAGATVPGMKIDSDLTVERVVHLMGEDHPVEVMEVATQDQLKSRMSLREWKEYFCNGRENRKGRLLNVISLEISHCLELMGDWQRPRCVDKTDLISQYWPNGLTAPKIKWYCLMTVEDAFTDFHIDFGGSSVFYHLIQGRKRFYFIPPSAENYRIFEKWSSSAIQSSTFLPDLLVGGGTYQVDLEAGDTLFLPSGWIHAVYTPEDSLIIGGNFLHDKSLHRICSVYQMEQRLKLPQMFRLPYFEKILWFSAIFWNFDDCGDCSLQLEVQIQCMASLTTFMTNWLYDAKRKASEVADFETLVGLILAPRGDENNDFSLEKFIVQFRDKMCHLMSRMTLQSPNKRTIHYFSYVPLFHVQRVVSKGTGLRQMFGKGLTDAMELVRHFESAGWLAVLGGRCCVERVVG